MDTDSAMEVDLTGGSASAEPSLPENNSPDLMREGFKYFKRRKPPPDLSNVIDFDQCEAGGLHGNVKPYQVLIPDDRTAFQELGLVHPQEWKAFSLESHPGMILLRNPFTAAGQRHWAGRCVRDLPGHPNKTNLDAQGLLPPGGNWWKHCLDGVDWERLKKLRWVTLGFHHDWETKLYNLCDRSPFPSDLARLASLLAGCVGWPSYSPEAAIVNFYHSDSTLAPHTDHSEWDMTAPLLSLSFGQSAVFLLGGRDRSQAPVALYLRSGDVLVMTGPSRLSYHAVPRLMPATDARWHDGKRKLSADCCGQPKLARVAAAANGDVTHHRDVIRCECESGGRGGGGGTDPVIEYLSRSRINVNVRQVFPRGLMLRPEDP
ncbi:nucleic acid dioxygenase ALKBH1-like [Amphibalanus amphitrite]|uniref:nucleic acid dioxygenase ALKBH1-like n=1 Tax=Amphibalanus amphitrite TaxID=1232801 RepID=UPI001C920D4B|nr:nucleic acid dioxygenase ALKBH1-like [Amphibalanus amphitrite]XP_043204411.1 nucleic acid dioxygenase ALKBH1-like [Amphibalanus amphitrite]